MTSIQRTLILDGVQPLSEQRSLRGLRCTGVVNAFHDQKLARLSLKRNYYMCTKNSHFICFTICLQTICPYDTTVANVIKQKQV